MAARDYIFDRLGDTDSGQRRYAVYPRDRETGEAGDALGHVLRIHADAWDAVSLDGVALIAEDGCGWAHHSRDCAAAALGLVLA